jgi:hypothetical protein
MVHLRPENMELGTWAGRVRNSKYNEEVCLAVIGAVGIRAAELVDVLTKEI